VYKYNKIGKMPGQECNTNDGVPILENYQSHRIHRGAATHAVSGTTIPPPTIERPGRWRIGNVLEVYNTITRRTTTATTRNDTTITTGSNINSTINTDNNDKKENQE